MSSSLPDQLQKIFSTVTAGLKGVSSSHRAAIQRQIKKEHLREAQKAEEAWRLEHIRRGTWHDGRLDCVAGNGVMSELGIGDEPMLDIDMEAPRAGDSADIEEVGMRKLTREREAGEERERKQRSVEDMQAVRSLPIVVIKNFAAKGTSHEELLAALSHWAATLTDTQIAHVVILSDNRENVKPLAKGKCAGLVALYLPDRGFRTALPSKPLNSIALYDADASSALNFVHQKLQDAGVDLNYGQTHVAAVERLGGRVSDLESVSVPLRSRDY